MKSIGKNRVHCHYVVSDQPVEWLQDHQSGSEPKIQIPKHLLHGFLPFIRYFERSPMLLLYQRFCGVSIYALVAQLVERSPCKGGVLGSSPSESSICDSSSIGRASAFQAECLRVRVSSITPDSSSSGRMTYYLIGTHCGAGMGS